jgi:hypothetical protein
LLSALKTLCIAKEITLKYNETNKRLLDTANCLEQVPPEMENRKLSACFTSGDSFTIKYTTVPKIYKRFSNLS